MQTISTTFGKNKPYFIGLLVFLLSSWIILLWNGQSTAAIPLTKAHPFLLNVFFINYTFIGDGIFVCCVIAVLFFYYKKRTPAFAVLFAFLFSTIVIQVIKNCIDPSSIKLFFEAGQYLQLTDNFYLDNFVGLPSGHTATVFALATVLITMRKDKSLQLVVLIAAILAGYSRMYLAQHFLQDIIAGAAIGSTSAIAAVYLATNSKGIKRNFKKMHHIDSKNIPAPHPAIPTV